MISFFRKINIFYKNIVKSIRRAFHEFGEEVFIIIRNRNYAKKHPNLFAIFSIIEQEQNTQIFELQKEEFHKIKANVLKDKDASNHHILEALRGLFNNNKILSNQNEIRQQLSSYLF